MFLIMLDANPTIAMLGQIAAIIICVFILIAVLLMVAVNLGLAFGTAWLREKINLIKVLRPTVDSVNKTSEAALQGQAPRSDENQIVRAVATVPGGVHTVDQKVNQATNKVANAVIEFRARTVQAETVVKTFLGLHRQPRQTLIAEAQPGATYPQMVEQPPAETPAELVATDGSRQAQTMTASQVRNVSSR